MKAKVICMKELRDLRQSAASSPCHILIVEDSEEDLSLMMMGLEDLKLDCKIHVAKDGEQALKLAQSLEGVLSLIILDLNLPRLNGKQVLKGIRSSLHSRIVPVVILTTSMSEADMRSAYEYGANAYLTKPANLDDFFLLLKRLVMFWLKTNELPLQSSV